MYDFMLKRHLLEGEYSKVILGIMINYLNDKMLQIDPKEIE